MISIFIPTYNGEKYIAKTLDSILGQVYENYEVICVDDQSNDSTYDILHSYTRKDSRIRIFQKSHEGDVPHSWQYALSLIKGDYTLYMSQDDLLDTDTLLKLEVRYREANADAVLPTVVYYEEDKNIEDVHCYKGIKGDFSQVLTGKDAFELMLDYDISGFALWKTDIIKSIGMRVEAYNSDEVAQREWIANCRKVVFSDAVFYYRRDNPHAITRSFGVRDLFVPISNARLLELAIQNQLDSDVIQNHRNKYYEHLWWCAMYMIMHENEITNQEKERLRSSLSEAYQILHYGVKLNKWYIKLSVISKYLFWVTLYVKLFIAKVKNVKNT